MKQTFLVCVLLLLAACSPTDSPASTNATPKPITLMVDGQASQLLAQGSTVRDAILQAGIRVRAADLIDPPLQTPLAAIGQVTITHARAVSANVDGKHYSGYSLKQDPFGQLADLGFHPGAMDLVSQADDGTITLQRVAESLQITADPIAFKTEYEKSDALGAGQTKTLQAGVPGLEIGQVRIASLASGETLREVASPKVRVSDPINQLVQISSTSAVGTIKIGNQTYNYWKALDMYTTSYSPCGQGTSSCSTGTASGMKVAFGVVAVRSFVFNALAGTQVYIPGYGIATIGDVGGGFPDGRPWIDLAYSDADYVGWSGYHTVYFLGEAPAYDPFGN